jgi:hypothetical protein
MRCKNLFVLSRIAKFIIVLALTSSIGVHWAFFQSIAWTSMLADNLRHDSVVKAVTRTFDGKHPCCLCKAITEGKKSEKKNESVPSLKALEFPLAPGNFALVPPAHFPLPANINVAAGSISETPPTPPPRAC